MHKLQSIHPTQNQKQIMHENDKLYILRTGRKTTRSIKKNKGKFINVIGDKLAARKL